MSPQKETKLAGKMRALVRARNLPAHHPLIVHANALDIAASGAFAPGGARPGAHRAYQKAVRAANALYRHSKQTSP